MVISGQEEGSINIDFSVFEESDKQSKSHYVVGGRLYYEVDVLGNNIASFTTKGFFDKLGYQEPI
jgi:hypothetical protein